MIDQSFLHTADTNEPKSAQQAKEHNTTGHKKSMIFRSLVLTIWRIL